MAATILRLFSVLEILGWGGEEFCVHGLATSNFNMEGHGSLLWSTVLHVCLGPFLSEWGEVGVKEEDVERSQLSPNVAKHFGLHTQDRVRQGLTPKVWRQNNRSGKEEEKTPHSKYEEEKTMEVEEEEDYTHNWNQEFAQLAWSISFHYISIYNFICTRDPSLHNAFKYSIPCSSQKLKNSLNKYSPRLSHLKYLILLGCSSSTFLLNNLTFERISAI